MYGSRLCLREASGDLPGAFGMHEVLPSDPSFGWNGYLLDHQFILPRPQRIHFSFPNQYPRRFFRQVNADRPFTLI